MKRIGLIIAAMLALVPGIALAVAMPDVPPGLSITQCSAYRDMDDKAGSFLMVCRYNLPYASLPTDDADTNFIGILLSGTTVVKTNTPYAYNDGGYNIGVISFYLTAAETLAQTWTNASGVWAVWPPSPTLSGKISGSPTIFSTLPFNTDPLSSGDYSTGSGAAANKTQLSTNVLGIADALATAWTVTLKDEQTNTLNAAGTQYFTLAIPGLREMTDNIFLVSTDSPGAATPVPTPGAGTLWGDSGARLTGFTWLTDGFDSLGSDLGLASGVTGSLINLFVIIGMTASLGLKFGRMGAATGLILGLGIVTPVMAYLGLGISWTWLLIVAFMLIGAAALKLARERL